MIKLLIIDDEPEVRDLLSIMLRTYPDLTIIGAAANVDEGVKMTLEENPDLVLLDIQMPEKDGFTYLEELRSLKIFPGIIFITAYENYAIRAIKNAASDYLIKPVKKNELFDAIERFTIHSGRSKKSDLSELIHLLQKTKPARIKLNTRTGYFFVDPDDIMVIEADGNYSHIRQISGKTELSTLSLGNLERLLETGTFLRVSRSFIINMKYISRVDRKTNICELEYEGNTHQLKIPPQKVKLLEAYY